MIGLIFFSSAVDSEEYVTELLQPFVTQLTEEEQVYATANTSRFLMSCGHEIFGKERTVSGLSDRSIYLPEIFLMLAYRETHLTSIEEVQGKTENLLKRLPLTLFQNCYQQGQRRMQKCVMAEENLFEGDSAMEN
ncbi:hypothetical protein TNCV_1446721 [Trichonephila clavipes]|nr:hypothetical protein TNCV_1446721 [Trichonephila clavipes]